MSYKTIDTYVEIDVDLDEWTDEELVEEMRRRNFTCTKEEAVNLEREDWQYLIELLDKNTETWYTRRIRDKLMVARHG